jgi:transcriptional regulator with XRE-family HTH domain
VPDPRLRLVDRVLRRLLLTVGDELRRARLNAGLSQRVVARALACSAATVSRVERGLVRGLTLERLLRHAAVVGLVGRVGLYPAGTPVRDAAQLRLLDDLKRQLPAAWRWRTEVPLGIPGDLRAADAVAFGPGCRIQIEAITRLGDIQAQFRAVLLKQRDGGFDRLIVVVRGTAANRRALRLAGTSLEGTFPLATREAIRALRSGADPGANAIVVL